MDDIVDWLNSLGLAEYGPKFVENAIDFSVLSDLDDAGLKELGVTALGHRLKLLRAISERAKVPVEVVPISLPAAAGPAPARSPALAERRHLTVMFCDLVGSTALR